MRFTDLVITVPTIVIGAVIGKLSGQISAVVFAVSLGLILWTTLSRLVRGEFLALREREFVDAARVAGASSGRIIFKHILPNAIGTIIVSTTLLMSSAILLETALSYLGFGITAADDLAGPDDPDLPAGVLDASVAVLVAGHLHRDHRAERELHR